MDSTLGLSEIGFTYGMPILKWVAIGLFILMVVRILAGAIKSLRDGVRRTLTEVAASGAARAQPAFIAALHDFHTLQQLERAYHLCDCIQDWAHQYLAWSVSDSDDEESRQRQEQWINRLESHPLDDHDRMVVFGYARDHVPFALELKTIVNLCDWPERSREHLDFGLLESFENLEEALQGIFDASMDVRIEPRKAASEPGALRSMYDDRVEEALKNVRRQLSHFRGALIKEMRRIRTGVTPTPR